ncbi:MAG: NAD(P)H-dependent oxidoreductase, partial [Clostridiales bacterium]|nr:NAD(P)H-dependent oxidoreductase [Clostridiales bacterium]
MEKIKVGVIIGSLRKAAFSRKMAGAVKELASASMTLEELEIGDLELYNQDLEDAAGGPPASWNAFREKLGEFDAFIFITPEYNRSVPAALKNALDVGSRPREDSRWNGIPAAVISVSPGAMGAFGANHHLRQTLVFLNMPTMAQPEAYIGNAASLFDEEGRMTAEKTAEFLKKYLE